MFVSIDQTAPLPASIQVVAAVVQREHRYLVCQRPLTKRHGGLWEFPGGKCEPQETLFDAARRELQEELGLSVLSVTKPSFIIADPGSNFVIEFVPTTVCGEPTCFEHSAYRWATLDDLTHLDLAPSDRRFVEFLQSHP